MKKHIKLLTLAGLLSAFSVIPLDAQAHDSRKRERCHACYHRAINRARHHRAMAHFYRHHAHKYKPKKVVYVYKKYDDDYKDKLIAATLAQTALLLALD